MKALSTYALFLRSERNGFLRSDDHIVHLDEEESYNQH